MITMTDKETVLKIFKNFIVQKDNNLIQLSNSCYGEQITIEFDENGKVIDVYA